MPNAEHSQMILVEPVLPPKMFLKMVPVIADRTCPPAGTAKRKAGLILGIWLCVMPSSPGAQYCAGMTPLL